MATEKLSATKLARRNNTSAAEIQGRFIHLGYIEVRGGRHHFTELGRSVGGEFRKNHPTDDGYMVWPIDLLREHPAMTIEEFYDELNRHDWYCGYSDDYSVEKRGEENYTWLLEIANQHGADYQALIGAFQKHYFSGKPWNTPQHDKPARPVNGVLVLPPAPPAGADAADVHASRLED